MENTESNTIHMGITLVRDPDIELITASFDEMPNVQGTGKNNDEALADLMYHWLLFIRARNLKEFPEEIDDSAHEAEFFRHTNPRIEKRYALYLRNIIQRFSTPGNQQAASEPQSDQLQIP